MAYLIKNADIYAPEHIGVQDILVVADKIVAVGKDLTVVLPDLETVDVKGLIVTPGFIDQHIHVTGGGGEGGPRTRYSGNHAFRINYLRHHQPGGGLRHRQRHPFSRKPPR